MLYCERCGTGFNGAARGHALACPRCKAKDGVFSPLTYEMFDPQVPRKPRREPRAGRPSRREAAA